MVDLAHFIESRGSLVATWELHRIGMNRHSIAQAVSGGQIVRVRQGWYCNPWLEIDCQRAARIGGQLACTSAARFLGLWVPTGDNRLHVVVDPNSCRLREPTSYRKRLSDPSAEVHWTGRDESFSRVVVPGRVAVEQIARCASPEFTLVVVESALNKGLVTLAEWDEMQQRIPGTRISRIPSVSRLSGSGVESIFVSRIRALGLDIRQQVLIRGVGYVDAVIGERLIVELDGEQFHQDAARDRRRDAVASASGFRVLRFLANQVTREWELVERAVIAAVVRGDHLAA